jgi:hypothetical protein
MVFKTAHDTLVKVSSSGTWKVTFFFGVPFSLVRTIKTPFYQVSMIPYLDPSLLQYYHSLCGVNDLYAFRYERLG